MPGLRFSQLVDQFVRTLEQQGATVLVEDDMQQRPARIRVVTSKRKTDCLLYLWTVTPGGGQGGERPEGERRIQITSVSTNGFPLMPGVRTLIGGFNEETGAWAFWDARFHGRFSPRSPSLQVRIETLEKAFHNGIETQIRPVKKDDTQEVVAAVSSESLLWFVEHGEALHNVGDDAAEVADLIDGTPEDEKAFVEEASTQVEAVRRVELIETLRRFRDSRFRPKVLLAYRYQCAVCGTALKLVEAAHIVPVSDSRSSDDVTNGMALCRLHHGAYDNGLLGIQSNYRIVLNPAAIKRLEEANLIEGIETFKQNLPSTIRLPSSLEVQPAPANLRLGLEVRQFPSSLIT